MIATFRDSLATAQTARLAVKAVFCVPPLPEAIVIVSMVNPV
jgi:hypothetical protein